MKKSILSKSSLAAGLLGLAVCSSSASANMSNCRFYVGAGADYNNYSFGIIEALELSTIAPNTSKIESSGMGFYPLVGMKFHKYLGVEAGYSWHKKIKFILNEAEISSYKVKNMYMDFMGFASFFKNMEILAGIGISKLNVKPADLTYGIKDISNKLNWRFKVGLNYHVHKNFDIRAAATCQGVYNKIKENNFNLHPAFGAGADIALNNTKFINNLISIGLGLTYKF